MKKSDLPIPQIIVESPQEALDLSVVVPFYNEEESLPELFSWLAEVLYNAKLRYEIIGIDDGSTDNSWEILSKARAKDRRIKGIKFRHNQGKSEALEAGFMKAKGGVVIMMDADLQDSPDELPVLYKMIKEDGYDLVSGWKKKRHDPLSKTIPSKLFNNVVRLSSGLKLHDFNCGLKAFKKEVVKSLDLQGEMHRYIPVLAYQLGFKKIGEKIVEHRARKFGKTKFGMERFLRGFLDLLTVNFISKFGKRPMHFFGTLGVLSFALGFISSIVIGYSKMKALREGLKPRLITEMPYFYIALTLMIIGTLLFLAGFLGELISRTHKSNLKEKIEEEVG